VLNEVVFLQILISFTLIFFINVTNILMLWYLAGIYLIALGLFLILDDCDIFIGFLWVIDLGVGLIFFIFILHFSNFLHQKAITDITSKHFSLVYLLFIVLFIVLFFFNNPSDVNFNQSLSQNWNFYLSWYDYYDFFYSFTVTDLNLLRYMYFYNNSFEFFIINFMLLYGLFAAINLCFLIKRVFSFLNFSQLNNTLFFHKINTFFFIRNQNFIKQQNTSTGTRVWTKVKKNKI